MSQQLFNWGLGGKDQNDVSYLSGSGAPAAATSYYEEAALGSVHVDINTGILYYKVFDSSPSGQASDWEAFDPDQFENISSFIGQDSPGQQFPNYGSPLFHITEGSPNSLRDSLTELDQALGDNTWTQKDRSGSPTDFELDPAQSVYYNLEVLDTVIGADAEIVTPTHIDPNQSIYWNLNALDDAIANGQGITQSQVDNVTTEVTIDSIAVVDAVAAKWFVTAINTDSPQNNREGVEVYAMNDGATDVDYNVYSLLKNGPNINGLTFSVDIDSGNMRLRVESTQEVDVKAARLQVVVT